MKRKKEESCTSIWIICCVFWSITAYLIITSWHTAIAGAWEILTATTEHLSTIDMKVYVIRVAEAIEQATVGYFEIGVLGVLVFWKNKQHMKQRWRKREQSMRSECDLLAEEISKLEEQLLEVEIERDALNWKLSQKNKTE